MTSRSRCRDRDGGRTESRSRTRMRAAWRGWCGRNWWQRDRTSRRIGQGASSQGQDRCGVLAWLPVEEGAGGAGRRRRCAVMEAAGVAGGNTTRPRAEVARRRERRGGTHRQRRRRGKVCACAYENAKFSSAKEVAAENKVICRRHVLCHRLLH